jgi:GntR family transcriptional regulator
MPIQIKNSPGTPIYEQIKEQIKVSILTGELHEGDVLPSIRQLARDLKVSVITTTRAYTELEQEGYIVTVQGKGCFVASTDNELIREQLVSTIEEHFEAAIGIARIAQLTKEELRHIFDFVLEGNNEPSLGRA